MKSNMKSKESWDGSSRSWHGSGNDIYRGKVRAALVHDVCISCPAGLACVAGLVHVWWYRCARCSQRFMRAHVFSEFLVSSACPAPYAYGGVGFTCNTCKREKE